jgi:hypothetical protein
LGVRDSALDETGTESAIEQLTSSMSTSDIGFRPTNQRVYEIDLSRILPDPSQPRRLLPHDLRAAVNERLITPENAMEKLIARAERNDTVALLILGGKERGPVGEDDTDVEDTGLLALARSILEIGLRHPLNVYRVDDPFDPDRINYRVGEGERRFWAHHLLVFQGYEQFSSIKCIVENLPDDEEVIHLRQEAENAARVDLPAIARARSMSRIKERLAVELGTQVPGENTIRLPSQRDLQVAVGQQVKTFTGRAIGDRMVRNYLALLNLSPEAQDLTEAAQLTEKQLRPVMRLKTDKEQLEMIRRVIDEKWSGRQVLHEIAPPSSSSSTGALREVKQISIGQRFERRILDAAKTMHSLLTLPQENYEEAIMALAARAKEATTRQALQSLRQMLEEVLLKVVDFSSTEPIDVTLLSIVPPLDVFQHHLPVDQFDMISSDSLTGSQILDQLLQWQKEDAVLASRLASFFERIEINAEALRAAEPLELPTLEGEKNTLYPDLVVYKVLSGKSIYWAHELLVKRGELEFKIMTAQVVNMIFQ